MENTQLISYFIYRDVEMLQDVFKIYPLLIRLFVRKTPIDHLCFLIGKVPTSVLIMKLIESLNKVLYSTYIKFKINMQHSSCLQK